MTTERMFEAVGLTALEEQLYRTLLKRRDASTSELAESSSVSPRRARLALESLAEKGLVSTSPHRDTRYMALPPEPAVDGLIHRARERLERAHVSATTLMREFRQGAGAGMDWVVELVTGAEAIRQRVRQMQQGAQKAIWMTDKPPYVATPVEPSKNELSILARGIEWRTLYAQESLAWPGQMTFIEALTSAGEIARVHPDVPMKIVIVDGAQALMPLSMDVESVIERAIVVHRSTLLDALMLLYELLWDAAVPIVTSEESVNSLGLTAAEQNLLRLLIAGVKEEVIARELGVVRRTVQRRIDALMRKAGARTRMQLGVQAARRGWI